MSKPMPDYESQVDAILEISRQLILKEAARIRVDKPAPKTHLLDCPECGGSGEVLDDGVRSNDPSAKAYACGECHRGQVECSGCDVCWESRR